MPKGLLEAVAKMGIDMKLFTETVIKLGAFPTKIKTQKNSTGVKMVSVHADFLKIKNPPLQ